MVMSKNRKKLQVTDVSNILFTNLARHLLNNDEQENLVISRSLLDYSRSILMLSHVYRPVFREKFQDSLHFLTRDLDKNPGLLVYTFSDMLTENYSSFKFLVWSSFVSEVHLFMCDYQNGNKEEYYIKQCNIVYKDVFDLAFDPDFYNNPQRWIQVFWTAAKIAKKFTLMKPLMNGITLKGPGNIIASSQDTTTREADLNKNQQLQTVAVPGSSQKMDMDDSSSKLNEVKPATSPEKFLQVFESLVYSHKEDETTLAKCLFLDHLVKRCTLGGSGSLLETYYDADESSSRIESSNSIPANNSFGDSENVKTRKRTASTSKGNSPKREKNKA